MRQTIDQLRAKFALEFIVSQTNNTDKDKLNTHIHKMPALILQCGLGQTLAFLLADAGPDNANSKPSKRLYLALQTWLCGPEGKDRPIRIYRENSLIDALINGNRTDYFRAQEEVLLLLNWMKRFADAKFNTGNAQPGEPSETN